MMNQEILMMLIAGAVALAIPAGLLWRLKSRRGGGSDGEPADPLAEADVYEAYGRKAQAIQMLEAALVRDPENTKISSRLKQLQRSR